MKSHYTHPSKPAHQFTPFLSSAPLPRHPGKVSASNTIYLRDGEVVLYKRKDSRIWQTCFKLSDHRWHRYSTKHLNLEYAKETASALYDEIRFKEKLGISHSSRRFAHVAKDCIKELEQKIAAGICPMTNHDYIRAITLYLVPFFGNYQLENITAPVVAQYEAWRNLKMKRIPMSSTLMTHASAYNKVIQHAVLKGWLNPSTLLAHLGRHGAKGKARPGFTREEIDYLLDFLKDYSQGGHSALAKQMRLLARDYIELLIYTGIRSGKECMNLKWQDVQWYVDARTGKRYIRIWVNGKTGARFLIAKNHLQAALERLCQRDAALKGKPLEQVLNERHNLPIFRLPSGKQPKSFHTTFKWLMLASGLLKDRSTNQNRTLYSLRHTYATLALTDGAVDIHTLARQMGTSVGMLEKHYSKLTATLAAEKLAY